MFRRRSLHWHSRDGINARSSNWRIGEVPVTRNATLIARPRSSRAGAAVPAAVAILFGVFLILGAGFSHSDIIHSAAHDSRHAFAFPCH